MNSKIIFYNSLFLFITFGVESAINASQSAISYSNEWEDDIDDSYLNIDEQKITQAGFESRVESLRRALLGNISDLPIIQKRDRVPQTFTGVVQLQAPLLEEPLSHQESQKNVALTSKSAHSENQSRDNKNLQEESFIFLDTELHAFIRAGEIKKCSDKLTQDVINIPGKDKKTLMHLVAEYGNEGLCAEIIHLGANHSLKDSDGNTPLHIACLRNNTSVVLTLLRAGAVDSFYNKHGLTALHSAVHSNNQKLCLLLIHEEADLSIGTLKEGNTPLHIAAEQGSKKIVKLLLELGASVSLRNYDGKIPLDIAIQQNELEIAELLAKNDKTLLIERAICLKNLTALDRFIKDSVLDNFLYSHGLTAFHLAAALPKERRDLLDGLIYSSKKIVSLPMTPDEKKAQKALLKRLLELNFLDVNKQDNSGRTPFLIACEWGREAAVDFFEEISSLDKDALLKVPSDRTYTPLKLALAYDYAPVAKKFIDRYLSEDQKAQFEKLYPDLMEASIDFGSPQIAELLISYKKNYAAAISYDTYFLLHRACFRGNLVICELLVSEPKNLNEQFCAEKYPGDSAVLRSFCPGEDEITPIAYAAAGGHLNVVTLLSKKGALINMRTRSGKSPTALACKNNHEPVVSFLTKNGAYVDEYCLELASVSLCQKLFAEMRSWYESIPVIERRNIDELRTVSNLLALKDRQGKTVLHREAESGNPEKCRIFLQEGAQLASVDKQGRTALHLACMMGSEADKFRFDRPCRIIQTLVDHSQMTSEVLERRDRAGKTALEYLQEAGKYSTVAQTILNTARTNFHK